MFKNLIVEFLTKFDILKKRTMALKQTKEEKQRQAILVQRKKENAAYERLFDKNQKEILAKYKGKVIALRNNEIYAADSRQELWEIIGNPGRGSGFIADLRQIDPETGTVIYPPRLY